MQWEQHTTTNVPTVQNARQSSTTSPKPIQRRLLTDDPLQTPSTTPRATQTPTALRPGGAPGPWSHATTQSQHSRVATSAGVLRCDCALCASPTAGLNDNDHAQSSPFSKQLKQLACQTYHSQHTTTTHHEWKQFETTPTTTLTPIDNLNSPPHIYNNDFHKQNTKTTAQLLPRNHRYWNS